VDSPWVTAALTGLLAVLGVAIAGWLQSRRERRAADRAIKTPTPPTTQELWQRLDNRETTLRSAVYVIDQVAEQWPHEKPPTLHNRHAARLAKEGYLPPAWEPPSLNTEGGHQ
jgi:hypothetical protein